MSLFASCLLCPKAVEMPNEWRRIELSHANQEMASPVPAGVLSATREQTGGVRRRRPPGLRTWLCVPLRFAARRLLWGRRLSQGQRRAAVAGIARNVYLPVGELGINFVHHLDHVAGGDLLRVFIARHITLHMAEKTLLSQSAGKPHHRCADIRILRQNL